MILQLFGIDAQFFQSFGKDFNSRFPPVRPVVVRVRHVVVPVRHVVVPVPHVEVRVLGVLASFPNKLKTDRLIP